MFNVTTLGRLASNIDVKTYTTPGADGAAGETRCVATFLLASDRPYKNKDGKQVTDFIRAKAWNGLGETLAKYFSKGDKIMVFGHLESSDYQRKTAVACPSCSQELEFTSDKIIAWDLRISGFEFVEASSKRNGEQAQTSGVAVKAKVQPTATTDVIVNDDAPWGD